MTVGEIVAGVPARYEERIIRRRDDPVVPVGAIAVLGGNLAPRGAVIKHSAATPELQRHEGRAVVFDSVEDMALRLDDAATGIAADDVLVLRNAGPRGAPGMPEAGYIPIPLPLARSGVKDMVRISDARMSGTAFGTVVLHVTPEVRRRAGRSPSCGPATGSASTCRPAGWSCWLARPRSPRGFATLRRGRTRRSAGTRGSSTGTCCRRTRAWTSTS